MKIFNSSNSVLPEFTAEAQLDIITSWPRPIFYDRYTAMDIGFVDLTVVLFAYWDFDNAVLVIEDEFVINGHQLTTKNLAKNIKDKEELTWKNSLTYEIPDIYKRVSDNNLIVINDLSRDHALTFIATEKHEKMTYMSYLRDLIELRQIYINPRCKTLISHMKTASWDKSKKDFKRSPDGGHYDGVAALLYLSRNIDKTRNPYPNGYRYSQLGKASDIWIKDAPKNDANDEYNKLAKMFQPKSTFKPRK
jgi:phage terminase large subunit